ncbi:hypothetical protein B0T11DRAFT_275834, partial [Plectosphaerella cucumerina]
MQMGPGPLPMGPQPGMPTILPGPAPIPAVDTVLPGPAPIPAVETVLPGPAPLPAVESALPGPEGLPAVESALPGPEGLPAVESALPGPEGLPAVESALPGPAPLPSTVQLPQTAQLPAESLPNNLPTIIEGPSPGLPSATLDGAGLPLPTAGSVIPELPQMSMSKIVQSVPGQIPPVPSDLPQATGLPSAILDTVCTVVEGQGDAITTKVIPCPQASAGSLPTLGQAPIPTPVQDG